MVKSDQNELLLKGPAKKFYFCFQVHAVVWNQGFRLKVV